LKQDSQAAIQRIDNNAVLLRAPRRWDNPISNHANRQITNCESGWERTRVAIPG